MIGQDGDIGMNCERPHDGSTLAEFKGLKVIDCGSCGFAHLVPLPALTGGKSYYDDDFYEKVYPSYIANHQADAEWLDLEANDQYQEFEKLLPTKSPLSLLDIGCGPGFFLRAGRKRGWVVRGVEPSAAAFRFATEQLGLDVVKGYFPLQDVRPEPMVDVVSCKKVLEHIPDPLAFLRAMTTQVVPGGLVCVSVPNEFNPLQRAFTKATGKSAWWLCEEHVNYFSLTSLVRLAERAGLKTERVTTDFPMELFLLMGDDYTVDDTLGRSCHQRRKNFEQALAQAEDPSLRRTIYDGFARCGIGRMITYIGRTPSAKEERVFSHATFHR